MSTTILEVIEAAGYDVRNNVDDAKWLLEQDDEYYSAQEAADDLVEEYEEWEDTKETVEEYGGHDFPSFEEWRKEKNNGRN